MGVLQDGFRRKVAQVVLAAMFFAICIPSILLTLLLVFHRLKALQGWAGEFANTFMLTLSYPLVDPSSQLSSVLVATLPAIVAVVCYETVLIDGKAQASNNLNWLGKVVLVGLILGAATSFGLLIVFNVAPAFVDQLVGNLEVTSAVKLVVTGILSFQLLYIIKLMGIEDAVAGTST